MSEWFDFLKEDQVMVSGVIQSVESNQATVLITTMSGSITIEVPYNIVFNEHRETEPHVSMMDSIVNLREALQAIVAGVMSDGFTEDQAREIAVAVWVGGSKNE